MAEPAIVRGQYLDILVGNGATPEVFTKICGLTTKTFTAQKNTGDVFIDDCDDPELIAVRRLNITGLQWDLSGDGLYNRTQGALIRSLVESTESVNMRFVISEPTGDNIDGGYFEGMGQVTNVQWGGPAGGEFATISITIASDSRWVWVDA